MYHSIVRIIFLALKIHISKGTADCLSSKFKEYKLIPRGKVEIKVSIPPLPPPPPPQVFFVFT